MNNPTCRKALSKKERKTYGRKDSTRCGQPVAKFFMVRRETQTFFVSRCDRHGAVVSQEFGAANITEMTSDEVVVARVLLA